MKLKIDNTPGPGHYNSQTIFASRKKPLLLRWFSFYEEYEWTIYNYKDHDN